MQLRVATWNIWGRFGDFRGRQSAIASTLQSLSPDLVGLVEIWWDESESQLEQLGERLGYQHRAQAEIGLVEGVPWGVGVLSRLPIATTERIEFANPLSGQPPGVALVAKVEAEPGAFDFVCMCEWGLTWSPLGAGANSDRLPSFQALSGALAGRRRPVAPILVGDLNAPPEARDIRALTGKEPQLEMAMTFVDSWEFVHGIQGGFTADAFANPHLHGTPFGRHRVDYVMTGAGVEFERLWRVNDASVFGQSGDAGAPPSDHYGVLAELELVDGIEAPSDDHVIEREA